MYLKFQEPRHYSIPVDSIGVCIGQFNGELKAYITATRQNYGSQDTGVCLGIDGDTYQLLGTVLEKIHKMFNDIQNTKEI